MDKIELAAKNLYEPLSDLQAFKLKMHKDARLFYTLLDILKQKDIESYNKIYQQLAGKYKRNPVNDETITLLLNAVNEDDINKIINKLKNDYDGIY